MTTTAHSSRERIALSARDVAQLLGVSERQVRRLTASGVLPQPALIGSRPRWDRDTVIAWWKGRADCGSAVTA